MKKPTQQTVAEKLSRVERLGSAPFTVLSLTPTANKAGGVIVRANCPDLGTLSGYFSGDSVKTLGLKPKVSLEFDIFALSDGSAEIGAPRISADDVRARLAKMAKRR